MTNKLNTPILVVILLIAALFSFANLGDRLLWQDEAEIAIVARNISQTKVPSAWDGRNIVSQQSGSEFGDDFVWRWSAWGTHYLAYLGMKIFGETPFGFRSLFALFGVLTVLALYFAASSWTGNKHLALLACALLLLSVPFFLHVRQCRYYPVIAFLGIIAMGFYPKLQNTHAKIVFIISSAVMAYFNELSLAFLMASLFIYSFLFDSDRKQWLRLISCQIAVLLLALPQFMQRMQIGGNGDALYTLTPQLFFLRLGKGFFGWNFYVMPLIILPSILILRKKFSPSTKQLALLMTCFLIVGQVVVAPLLSPDVRYTTYGFCLASILLASFLKDIWQTKKWLSLSMGILIFCTNSISVLPAIWPGKLFKAELLFFPIELFTRYNGPNETIVSFLNKNASPDDIVVVEYGQLPVMLHTNLKVGYMVTPERGKLMRLPSYIYDPYEADWFIARINECVDCPQIKEKDFLGTLPENIKATRIDLPGKDLKYGNYPNINHHEFVTPNDYGETIRVYRLVRK